MQYLLKIKLARKTISNSRAHNNILAHRNILCQGNIEKNYNKFYNNKKDYVAIGVLLGDDTFGYYKGGPEIYIHLDTGSSVDGEVFAIVADSLEDFLLKAFDM